MTHLNFAMWAHFPGLRLNSIRSQRFSLCFVYLRIETLYSPLENNVKHI